MSAKVANNNVPLTGDVKYGVINIIKKGPRRGPL